MKRVVIVLICINSSNVIIQTDVAFLSHVDYNNNKSMSTYFDLFCETKIQIMLLTTFVYVVGYSIC